MICAKKSSFLIREREREEVEEEEEEEKRNEYKKLVASTRSSSLKPYKLCVVGKEKQEQGRTRLHKCIKQCTNN